MFLTYYISDKIKTISSRNHKKELAFLSIGIDIDIDDVTSLHIAAPSIYTHIYLKREKWSSHQWKHAFLLKKNKEYPCHIKSDHFYIILISYFISFGSNGHLNQVLCKCGNYKYVFPKFPRLDFFFI